MEQEKNKLILMKDNKETTSHSFFIRTILKEQLDLLENKKNIRTINAEINKKTFYPSLENRNVLQLTDKYQKITYLQGEV